MARLFLLFFLFSEKSMQRRLYLSINALVILLLFLANWKVFGIIPDVFWYTDRLRSDIASQWVFKELRCFVACVCVGGGLLLRRCRRVYYISPVYLELMSVSSTLSLFKLKDRREKRGNWRQLGTYYPQREEARIKDPCTCRRATLVYEYVYFVCYSQNLWFPAKINEEAQ